MATSTAVSRARRTPSAAMKFSTFTYATAATHEVIAAVTDKSLIIWMVRFTVAGSVNAEFKSATTSLTQLIHCILGIPYCIGELPLFGSRTSTNSYPPMPCGHEEAFNLTLSGAVLLAGEVWYEEIASSA